MKFKSLAWEMGPPTEPPDIRGKDHDTAVDLMVQWFFQNFEDPVQCTPWEDGEYVFIWGGPFDACSEIDSAFGEMAFQDRLRRPADDNCRTYQALDDAVARIEKHGWQWAPNQNRMRPEDPTAEG